MAMLLNAYALLDTKVGVYGLPFFVRTDVEAFRMIYEAMSDDRSSVSKFPTDFVLYRVGAYETDVGSFANHAPHNLGSCAAIYARITAPVAQTVEA